MQQSDLRSVWTGACVGSWKGHEIVTPNDSMRATFHFKELEIKP